MKYSLNGAWWTSMGTLDIEKSKYPGKTSGWKGITKYKMTYK